MPVFKLSADPAVQTLCSVSLCCETTDRSKDCSWSSHCLSWGFFCKWWLERLWYLLSVTQLLLLFLLSEWSFGLFASAAVRLLTVVLCSYWFRSTNAVFRFKDLCTFPKLSQETAKGFSSAFTTAPMQTQRVEQQIWRCHSNINLLHVRRTYPR